MITRSDRDHRVRFGVVVLVNRAFSTDDHLGPTKGESLQSPMLQVKSMRLRTVRSDSRTEGYLCSRDGGVGCSQQPVDGRERSKREEEAEKTSSTAQSTVGLFSSS